MIVSSRLVSTVSSIFARSALFGGLLAIVFGFCSFGCQNSSPLADRADSEGSEESGSVAEADAAGQKSSPVDLRIPEDVLESNGLQTVWTRQPGDGPFDTVHVVGDDVYAVAKPKLPDRPKAGFICYKRSTGLHRWVRDIEGRLEDPPFVYKYPEGSAERTDELFTVERDKVVCRDLSNGLVLWDAKLNMPISSGVVASETHVFLGSYNRKIMAFRKREVFPDWFFITGGDVDASGVLDEPSIFFSSTDGKTYRFDTAKGPRFEGFNNSGIHTSGAPVYGAPLVHSRWVYVGSTDFKLYCLRARDFSLEWEHQAQAPIEKTPLAADFQMRRGRTSTVIFCVSKERRRGGTSTVWALDSETGKRFWKFDRATDIVAAGRNTIYVVSDPNSSRGKSLVALDVTNGEERFSLPVDGFDFIPGSVGQPSDRKKRRAIIFLVHRSGFMQTLGERM